MTTATQQRRPSARDQVARRDAESGEFANYLRDAEQRLKKATHWFGKVAPRHVDPEQYVELAIAHMRQGARVNPKLAQAIVQNPESLMVALVDCARYGLVVGDTYHLVPFWDKHSSTFVITGIRGYKGEIELIYRSGMVDAVFTYAVRGHEGAKTPDRFKWAPGMEFPEHVIADDGLADPADRGHLRGAYAYARMTTGGYSPVIVMSKAQILRTKPANAPAEFWGPDWPAEGPNTEAMWLKGPVHRLFSRVPHSADYVAEMQRAAAGAVEASRALAIPPPGVAAIGAEDAPQLLAGVIEPPGEGESRPSARGKIEKPKTLTDLRKDVNGLFAAMQFGEANDAGQRAAAATLLHLPVGSLADLTKAQAESLAGKLAQIRAEAERGNRDPADDLRRLAEHAAKVGTDG